MLAAWAASPARFREDANAEEDLALGAYRDRVVVELAQNAADAAARRRRARPAAARACHLGALDAVLVAANTGAPLDAAGVQALATLRASRQARRRRPSAASASASPPCSAVSDAPAVIGRAGGVRFSLRSRAHAARRPPADPALAAELERRGRPRAGAAPAAAGGRRACPRATTPPSSLPLREESAAAAVPAQLEAIDDGLLLALPALAEIEVSCRGSRRASCATSADGGGWPAATGESRPACWPTVRRRSASAPAGR